LWATSGMQEDRPSTKAFFRACYRPTVSWMESQERYIADSEKMRPQTKTAAAEGVAKINVHAKNTSKAAAADVVRDRHKACSSGRQCWYITESRSRTQWKP
jgi:hypothetical protein